MAKSAKPVKAKKAAPKKTALKTTRNPSPVAKKNPSKTTPDPQPVTKKTASKKEERTINIKYADKSAGQPELVVIFEAIKKMAEPYAGKGELVMHANTGGQFNLVSHKPVVIAGRPRKELWFVSALIQKGYVGFYFMPIYMNEPMQKVFSPEFIKCLKGKACFHIKKNDPLLMGDIKKAIKLGYEAYKDRGWI